MWLDLMSAVIIRAALITEKYLQFSQHICLITYFHYHGLNMYGLAWIPDNFAQNVKIYISEWVTIYENTGQKY